LLLLPQSYPWTASLFGKHNNGPHTHTHTHKSVALYARFDFF
jgi:hypothetical protein